MSKITFASGTYEKIQSAITQGILSILHMHLSPMKTNWHL